MSILYKSDPFPNLLTLSVMRSMEGKVKTKSVPKYWSLLMFELTASPEKNLSLL